MLDRRRSKSGGHDETGSPNSFLDSASPNGATETVYPPPEVPTSTPVRPVSTEPVTSTLPGLPAPFHTPLPIPNGPLHNSLFLPGFLPFPPLNFATPPPRNVSPQSSWRCPFCPFETLNEDTEGCRKHLLQHINDSPHSCLSCGHRCLNEAELFAHIQDVHGSARNGLGIGNALQAAVNRCYQSVMPEPPKEQDEPLPLSLSKVKEEPFQKQGTFSCIPCKADFSSEDDLECHVKSHAQILPDLPANHQGPEDLSTNSSRKRSAEDDSGSEHSLEGLRRNSIKSEHSTADEHGKHSPVLPATKPRTRFLCLECNKVFSSKHIYRYHAQMHMPIGRGFRCGVCRMTFGRKFELLTHTRQHHMTKFPCNKCSKFFTYRRIYQRHEKRCDGRTTLTGDLKRTNHRAECLHKSPGSSLPLIDVSLASSALGGDLIGVIPLLGDENQRDAVQNVLLGVPVINPSVLKTHQQFLKSLLAVRNQA